METIEKLPPPSSIEAIRSFLGHAGFYLRFIKDFSKIARSLTKLLKKDVPFEFTQECDIEFSMLKGKLINTHIMIVPVWRLPLELMCDVSDYAAGVVLGQRKGKLFQPIFFASENLDGTTRKLYNN